MNVAEPENDQPKHDRLRLASRRILIVILLLVIIMILLNMCAHFIHNSHMTGADVDQVIVGMLASGWSKLPMKQGFQSLEDELIVKVNPIPTDRTIDWLTLSPQAVWRFHSGMVFTATLDELDRAKRDQDVYITFFSIQGVSPTAITAVISTYYPVVKNPIPIGGGDELLWHLNDYGFGWQLVKNEFYYPSN